MVYLYPQRAVNPPGESAALFTDQFPQFCIGRVQSLQYLLDGKSRCFLSKYKKCVNYLTNSGDFVLVRLVSHQRHCLFGILTSPPAVALNSLWAFMAHDLYNYGYLSEVLCCKNTECKHYCILQAGVRWHHLPCDQWVRIHTDRLGHLVLQSVKTAFVEHSIPHQSHWWAGPRTPRNPPPPSPLRLGPAKAWPCREGRGHLAADATHWCLQLYRPSP